MDLIGNLMQCRYVYVGVGVMGMQVVAEIRSM